MQRQKEVISATLQAIWTKTPTVKQTHIVFKNSSKASTLGKIWISTQDTIIEIS